VNNFLGQLNLTAQERRIVVAIFLVVIVVLNYLFVWPRFGDWSSLNKQLQNMRKEIEKDNAVIRQDYNPTNGWKKQVELLTKREGGSVMEHPVDPQVQLQNTIRAQERKTGVFVESVNPGSVRTNEFFEEQSTRISLECQEPQLVGFLYHMGNDPAMIRVAMLDLKPADANRYRLKATLTLTANYAKKRPTAVSESAANKHAAGAKPAAAPGPKPAAAPGPKPASAPGAKPHGIPAPMQGPAAKHPPGGPFAPGSNRPPPAARNLPIPARPMPVPKPAPGQKAIE
jgi:hypothetical protein